VSVSRLRLRQRVQLPDMWLGEWCLLYCSGWLRRAAVDPAACKLTLSMSTCPHACQLLFPE
jgi:hypothetical protein